MNFYRYLDSVGDGAGTKDFLVDYSSSAMVAKIAPPVGKVFMINRLMITIVDTVMSAGKYGGLTALTNGLTVGVSNAGGVTLDITDGIPIKTNASWANLCYDADVKRWGGSPDNDVLVARFSFWKSGKMIGLNGDGGDFLWVKINDNMTGLIAHHFMAQGFIQ